MCVKGALSWNVYFKKKYKYFRHKSIIVQEPTFQIKKSFQRGMENSMQPTLKQRPQRWYMFNVLPWPNSPSNWPHYHNLLNPLNALSIHLTKVCSPRANSLATWTHEGHLWCEYFFFFSFIITSTIIASIIMAFTTLSSPTCTLYRTITSYMSKCRPIGSHVFVAPKSLI